MWIQWNPNPVAARVGDCAVRAVARVTEQDWERTYMELAILGLQMADMPSANNVWGAALRRRGFIKAMIPDSCPDCYTVADFAEDHPHGQYVVQTSGHVVAIEDGDWIDTWDSGQETVTYFWKRKDD